MCKKLFYLISFVLVLALVSTNVALGDVIDIPIAAENDDGEDHMWEAGAEGRGSSDLEMPYEDSGNPPAEQQTIGLRFVNIPISKGETIVSAHVQFTGDDEKLTGDPVNLIINGLLQLNPEEFGSGEGFSEREPKTAAEVKWTGVPDWSVHEATEASRSPDIASVIQEIVNQDGWVSGNALMLFVRDDETNPSGSIRSALSNGGAAGTEPLLHIEFVRTTKIEMRIDTETNDTEEDLNPSKLGEADEDSGDLELPYEDENQVDPQLVGVRYPGLSIPKSTMITEAWVRFQVDEYKGGTLPVNLIIEGELTPNAGEFVRGGPGTFDLSSRPRTTAQVQWSVPNWTTVGDQGPDQTTPNIAPIIQEIVNQDGWASGNALVLIFSDDPANPSTGIRCAEAGPGDDSALLHIEAVIEVAAQPYPVNGAEGVPVGVSLGWLPVPDAVSHDVYFGASSPPAFAGNQEANIYYPGPIEPGTTYYWQISEVKADGTTLPGDIWSFTTGLGNVVANIRIANGTDDAEEALSAGFTNWNYSSDLEIIHDNIDNGGRQLVGMNFRNIDIAPGEKISSAYIEFVCDETISGTDDAYLLIWGHLTPNPDGFIEPYLISDRPKTVAKVPWEPEPWSSVGQKIQTVNIAPIIQELIDQEGWAAGNAVEIIIGADPDKPAFYGVRCAESYDGVSSNAPLLQITAISEVATQPHPANGAANVPTDTTLSWWPGFSAVSHDGYIGTSSPPPFLDNTTEVSYDPGGLQPSTTYYWQINAVAADGTVHTGDIWSFTTAEPEPAP